MDETNRRLRQRLGSFFSSLTGLLTGAAALIGAVVGILTAVGVIGGGAQHAPAQTAASWAARANAICAQTNETVGALPDPHSIAPTDVAGYLKTSVVLGRRLLRRLTVLAPPSGREAEVAGFLRLGAQLNDATSELAHDVSLGDLGAAADRATQLSHLNTRFNDAAVALGATTCAEGSSVSDVFGG